MAITHLATTFSDYLVVQDDGRNTLIRTYQNIRTTEMPAVKIPFCVVVEMTSDRPEPMRVTLEGPPGERLIHEGMVEAPQGLVEYQQWSSTLTFEIQPGIFPEPGVYSIVVSGNDGEVHRRNFGVLLLPAPAELQDDEVDQDA
jgi:hypothetical protein